MVALKLKHGEIQVQASFATPLFELLDPPASRIHAQIFSALCEFGVTLNDVKLVNGVPNLHEASLTYHLLSSNSLVRLSLERIDLSFFETKEVSRERIEAIYTKTFESLGHIAEGCKIKDFTVSIALHGIIEGKTLEEFWKDLFVRSPQGLGPLSGQGVVFYYGGGGRTKSSSLVLDMSARITGALFLRSSVVFDGSKVSIADLPVAAEKAFDIQTNSLDLTVD